eukprot:maker-scaffold_1-snap-gene-28.28-mRNA-1 protein AED:0.15 eAED:0.15 QI:127/1/1/1/1/1/3/76/434
MFFLVFLLPAMVVALSQETNQTKYRILFGSCHDVNQVDPLNTKETKIWKSILDREPSAFLWLGDNIYGDSSKSEFTSLIDFFRNGISSIDYYVSDEYMQELYSQTLRIPYYQQLLNFVGKENVHGTWDDHDYGLSDAGSEFEHKEATQQFHLDFFDVPADDPRRFRDGIYHSKILFDGLAKVILLDLRFFRDSYSNSTGDMLGEDQWNFLNTELNDNSNVTLTLIASSLQALPDDKPKGNENWNSLPVSRQRLFNTIGGSSAENVIILSGDIHFSEISEAECICGDESFLLPEFTASGMTHSSGETWRSQFFKRIEFYFNPTTWHLSNSQQLNKNFGEIEVDLEAEVFSLRSFSDEGQRMYTKTYGFGDLKQSSSSEAGLREGSDCSCFPTSHRKRTAGKSFLLFLAWCLLVYIVWRLVRFFLLGSRPFWEKIM